MLLLPPILPFYCCSATFGEVLINCVSSNSQKRDKVFFIPEDATHNSIGQSRVPGSPHHPGRLAAQIWVCLNFLGWFDVWDSYLPDAHRFLAEGFKGYWTDAGAADQWHYEVMM